MSVVKLGALQDLNGNTELDLTSNIANITTVNSTTINNSGSLSTTNITTTNVNGANPSRLVQMTAQSPTSGTTVDFTGIPSWAKKVTIALSAISTNGTSNLLLQIGSGSILTSGYTSQSFGYNSGSITAPTNGFALTQTGQLATSSTFGNIFLTNVTGNIWSFTSNILNGNVHISSGGVTLSGALDRIRLIAVNATDQFDAGTVNVIYEG